MAKRGNVLFKRTAPEQGPGDGFVTESLLDGAPPEVDQQPALYKVKPLSVKERNRLAELEGIVKANFAAFYEVGCALREIQQSRLYRETHKTFADYASDLWDLARRTAYQYIEGADVVDNVRNCAQITHTPNTQDMVAPQNEYQARVLSKYPAEEQVRIWRRAVEDLPLNVKMTASHLRKTINKIGLKRVQKSITKARRAAGRAPKISDEFRGAFDAFIDQINVERAADWKQTDQKEAIRLTHVVLEALEAEL